MSSANVRLKAVRKLARRGAPELCLAEGAGSVRAALAAGAAGQGLGPVQSVSSSARPRSRA